MSKQTGMMSQVLTTSELMEQVQRNDVTVFTTWKTHEDFLPVKAEKKSLLENLQHQLEVNGEQQFGVMVKQETSVAFGVSWNEGAELFLL